MHPWQNFLGGLRGASWIRQRERGGAGSIPAYKQTSPSWLTHILGLLLQKNIRCKPSTQLNRENDLEKHTYEFSQKFWSYTHPYLWLYELFLWDTLRSVHLVQGRNKLTRSPRGSKVRWVISFLVLKPALWSTGRACCAFRTCKTSLLLLKIQAGNVPGPKKTVVLDFLCGCGKYFWTGTDP